MAVIFAFSSRNAELSTQDSTSLGMLFGQMFVPDFKNMDAGMQAAFADKIDHPVRKLAHVTEYAVLGLFIAGSYMDSGKKRRHAVGIPYIIGTFYAASDELHQVFVPGRSGQLTDIAIDSSGVLLGVLAGLLIWKTAGT